MPVMANGVDERSSIRMNAASRHPKACVSANCVSRSRTGAAGLARLQDARQVPAVPVILALHTTDQQRHCNGSIAR